MIRVRFLAMNRISHIGGFVSALLMLTFSVDSGYCQGSSRNIWEAGNRAASNSMLMDRYSQRDIENLMKKAQNEKKALQKAMQAQRMERRTQARQERTEKRLQAEQERMQRRLLLEQQRLAREKARLSKNVQKLQDTEAGSYANLKQQQKILELQKKQMLAQNAQRLKILRNQLNQEEARQQAQMKAFDERMSDMQHKVKTAQIKKKFQIKADQIFKKLKNKFSKTAKNK